ncbi:hypothetical protein ACQBJO_04410 [Janibacter sp. G349]|uniref:hypothetical protein n=1 Tax=Janibacter sp. G349 TaxID=3405424 RepID=UPI003B7E9853
MYSHNGTWGYAAIGIACGVISHMPIVLGFVPWLSLWGALSLVVTIGASARGLAIAFGYPDRTVLTNLFTLGVPLENLLPEAVLTLACLLTLTLGYMASVGFKKMDARRSDDAFGLAEGHVPREAFQALIGAYALVGAVATFLYFRAIGGAGADIAARRTVYTGESGYQSHGLLELLARAGTVALLLFLAYRLSIKDPWTPVTLIALTVLTVNAFAINWITTTRSDLLYVTLGCLLVVRLIRGRIPPTLVVAAALAVVLGIGALSAARSSAQGGSQTGNSASLAFGVDSGLLNRNAFDLSKTLHITKAVPNELPLQRGATIANYIFAPVPRSVWPNKPVVSPGPIIGKSIYGLSQTGVPPGLVAELVWNFGRVLAVVLAGLVGLLLGWVERRAMAINRRRIAYVLVYAMVVLPFGKAIMGVAIGQAFSAAGQAILLLAPLIWLDARLRRKARRIAAKSAKSARSAVSSRQRLAARSGA